MDYQLKELVIGTKKKDQSAEEQLLKKVKPLISSNIRRYGDFRCDKEAALQEGYLEAIRLTYEYDESKGVPFLAYLKRYLKYFYVEYFYRGAKVVTEESLDQAILKGDSVLRDLDHSLPIPEQYVQKELKAEIRDLLQQLTVKQKMVLQLYYFENMPMKDIAVKLGLHYMSVVKLKQRGLKRLREKMGNAELRMQNAEW